MNFFLWEGKNNDDKVLNEMCGTHQYCAPEMIQKKKYGFSVDMWYAETGFLSLMNIKINNNNNNKNTVIS